MMVGIAPLGSGLYAVSVRVKSTEPPRCTVPDEEVLVSPVSATTHTELAVASLGRTSPPGSGGR